MEQLRHPDQVDDYLEPRQMTWTTRDIAIKIHSSFRYARRIIESYHLVVSLGRIIVPYYRVVSLSFVNESYHEIEPLCHII